MVTGLQYAKEMDQAKQRRLEDYARLRDGRARPVEQRKIIQQSMDNTSTNNTEKQTERDRDNNYVMYCSPYLAQEPEYKAHKDNICLTPRLEHPLSSTLLFVT